MQPSMHLLPTNRNQTHLPPTNHSRRGTAPTNHWEGAQLPPITAQHTCLQPIKAEGPEFPTNPSRAHTCLPPIPAQHTCLPPMTWGQGSQRSPVGCHQRHQPHTASSTCGGLGGGLQGIQGCSLPGRAQLLGVIQRAQEALRGHLGQDHLWAARSTGCWMWRTAWHVVHSANRWRKAHGAAHSVAQHMTAHNST